MQIVSKESGPRDAPRLMSAGAFAAINLACGGKLCRQPGWVNADHNPSSKDVVRVNLLRALPFANGSFDVVYHSQFIEHLPEGEAKAFLGECWRILKPGGVIRVVTPDLQNQALTYLSLLQDVLARPQDKQVRLRYEWIRLEMLDQLTRHRTGGDMVGFLARDGRAIRDYLVERMGRSGANLLPADAEEPVAGLRRWVRRLRAMRGWLKARAASDAAQVGAFRLSGESHLCMYDEHLLGEKLRSLGFVQVNRVTAFDSAVPAWQATLLDSDEQGVPDCGVSLFMEAIKPQA
jgi:predicted SAM-dependent methyltransferase